MNLEKGNGREEERKRKRMKRTKLREKNGGLHSKMNLPFAFLPIPRFRF